MRVGQDYQRDSRDFESDSKCGIGGYRQHIEYTKMHGCLSCVNCWLAAVLYTVRLGTAESWDCLFQLTYSWTAAHERKYQLEQATVDSRWGSQISKRLQSSFPLLSSGTQQSLKVGQQSQRSESIERRDERRQPHYRFLFFNSTSKGHTTQLTRRTLEAMRHDPR